MQDSEGHRAMELVLTGDDDGVEQPLLGSIIQSICEGDSRAQVLGLSDQPNALHAGAHHCRILPAAQEKRRGQLLTVSFK